MGAVGDFFRSLRAELTPGCPSAPIDLDCNPFAPARAIALASAEPDPIEVARQRKQDAVRAVNDALTELRVANRRLRALEASEVRNGTPVSHPLRTGRLAAGVSAAPAAFGALPGRTA